MFRKVLTLATFIAFVTIGVFDFTKGALTPLGDAIGWVFPETVETITSHDSVSGSGDTLVEILVWLLNQPAVAVFGVLFLIAGILPTTSNSSIEFHLGGSGGSRPSASRDKQSDEESGGGFFGGGDGDGGGD